MKEKLKKHKKGLLAAGVLFLAAVTLSVAVLWAVFSAREKSDETRSHRRFFDPTSDTIELEGTVSVGTESQNFSLDIEAFSGQEFEWSMPSGGGFNGEMGGGMAVMGGTASNTSESSDTRQLTVEEVYVQVGQEIKAGDPILKISQESLASLREDFVSDAEEAENVYDQALTSQEQTQMEAALVKNENELYSSYADTEYQLSVSQLEEEITSIQENIDAANEELLTLQDEIVLLQNQIVEHQAALENANYAKNAEAAIDNPYGWLVADTTRIELENLIETANDTIESNFAEMEEKLSEIETMENQKNLAEYALQSGKIEAESVKQKRLINAEKAEEIYDVTVSLADFTAENALRDYEEAKEKLDTLDSYLAEGILLSEKDGVVTSISVAEGDSLQQNMELISVNNYEAITITLSVEETDMEAAALGSSVDIAFAAYPEEIFSGEVTNIGDAEMDSDTNTTVYEVEITIDAEEGSKLYEGMTAVVTLKAAPGEMRGGRK